MFGTSSAIINESNIKRHGEAPKVHKYGHAKIKRTNIDLR